MPLSTFNSDVVTTRDAREVQRSTSARAGIATLVSGLAALLLGLEISSPMILGRLSHTEQRVNAEMQAARHLDPVTADGRQTVLVVGNSLLLEGVQMDSLQSELARQYQVSRLAIEQTHYLDWYFGIRRLLQEGAHPGVIVLSLATDQLASPFTLGESFAYRQMSIRDFPQVVHEANLDRTTASTYLFAHGSNWQADKGFIRQCVMILAIPHFRELAAHIADHGPHVNDPATLLAVAKKRLPQLAMLSRTYRVRIVLLVPPTLREDHSREIQALGEQDGIPVWVLSPPGEFPRNYFRDGFHLNAYGSGIFTSRLSQQLRNLQSVQTNYRARHSSQDELQTPAGGR